MRSRGISERSKLLNGRTKVRPVRLVGADAFRRGYTAYEAHPIGDAFAGGALVADRSHRRPRVVPAIPLDRIVPIMDIIHRRDSRTSVVRSIEGLNPSLSAARPVRRRALPPR